MFRLKILMKKVRENDTLTQNLSDMRMGSNSKHERDVMLDILLGIKQNSPVLLTGFTVYSQCFYVCMYLCMLPFFSATTDQFDLKLSTNLCYEVRKTANHFDAQWIHI